MHSRGRRRSNPFEHFRRHVTLKDDYFCTCCRDMYGLHAGTRRAYIPMEYVMHVGLYGARDATSITASVAVLAQCDIVYEDDRWPTSPTLCRNGTKWVPQATRPKISGWD